jgi:hypothetical protein
VIEGIRAEAVEASVLLTRLALEAGDPVTSRRAAFRGLAADPAAEELWRQVMLAEDMAGSAAGVHRAWSRCLGAIADIAVGGEPHPATAALYRSLTSSRAQAARLPRVPVPAARQARLRGDRYAEVRAAG